MNNFVVKVILQSGEWYTLFDLPEEILEQVEYGKIKLEVAKRLSDEGNFWVPIYRPVLITQKDRVEAFMNSIKQKLAHLLFHALADDEYGDGAKSSPPGTALRLEFGELDGDKLNPFGMRPMYIASTESHDGNEIWLGTHDKWYVFYRAEDARRLAWFILWARWAKGTWFGLKRRIWYWALRTNLRSQPWYRQQEANRSFWQNKLYQKGDK